MSDLLTNETVYSAEPPAKGQRFIWDAEPKHGGVSGFGLRITATGARAFILSYRYADPGDGKRSTSQYRFTIGPAKASPRGPGWTVDKARKEADRWRLLIDRGETHPLAERRGRREAVKEVREAETFKEAVEDYIKREQEGRRGNATSGEVKRAMLRECAAWHDRPVKAITGAEVRKLVEGIRDGDDDKSIEPRPYLANRLFAYLRTFFLWCAEPGIDKVPTSPMNGLRRPWEGEESRERVLTDKEIKALWKGADAIGGTSGAFLKVLLLTGKRKNALAAMRWDEIDDKGLWTPPVDPRRRRKNKRTHAVPLPALARRILAPLRPGADDLSPNPHVFAGRKRGGHLDPGTPLQTHIKDKSGVADFFFHCTRHTVETRLAELGVPPHIRDLLLDHAPARGAGAGYDHHHYGKEMGEALDLWAGHVERVVASKGVKVLR